MGTLNKDVKKVLVAWLSYIETLDLDLLHTQKFFLTRFDSFAKLYINDRNYFSVTTEPSSDDGWALSLADYLDAAGLGEDGKIRLKDKNTGEVIKPVILGVFNTVVKDYKILADIVSFIRAYSKIDVYCVRPNTFLSRDLHEYASIFECDAGAVLKDARKYEPGKSLRDYLDNASYPAALHAFDSDQILTDTWGLRMFAEAISYYVAVKKSGFVWGDQKATIDIVKDILKQVCELLRLTDHADFKDFDDLEVVIPEMDKAIKALITFKRIKGE